jgi:hypothetical protein
MSYKFSYNYKNIGYALLVYKESYQLEPDRIHFNIRKLYTYGNDQKTRKIIANNDFILLEIGYEDDLTKIKNEIIASLRSNFISFKPTAYSKGNSYSIHPCEGDYQTLIMKFKSEPFEKIGTKYF